MTERAAIKAALAEYRAATASVELDSLTKVVGSVFDEGASIHMCAPFGDLTGGATFLDTCLVPLARALPDLERRDMIVAAGTTPEGQGWVGCMGNYMGTFLAPFLDIPPTGHLAHMRYHEFFRIEDGKVTEAQIIWDVPELMMQASAWPMAPQLGRFLCTPGPAPQDGLRTFGDGMAAREHVIAMLTDLCRYPAKRGCQ